MLDWLFGLCFYFCLCFVLKSTQEKMNELYYRAFMWWDKLTAMSTSYWHNVHMTFCSQHGALLAFNAQRISDKAQLHELSDLCCRSIANSRRLKAMCPETPWCWDVCVKLYVCSMHLFPCILLVWLAQGSVHWGNEELCVPCQVIAVEHAQLMRSLETRAQTESFLQYV